MNKDFSNQNLRGKSFKNRNLQGANFSHADIRSADFTNANLRNANFSYVKAGLKYYLAIILLKIAFICSALSSFALELGVRAVLGSSISKPIVSITFFFLLVTFYIVTILSGLARAVLVNVIIAIIVTVVGVGVGVVENGLEADAVVGAITGVFTIALVALGIVAVSIAGAVAVIVAGIKTIAGIVASSLVGISVAVFTGVIDQVTVVVVAITGTASIFSAYAAMRALAGEKKFAFIKSIAVSFTSIGGTIFRGADLTDANFTKATLKSTDLRQANISRTCWFQTTKLELARIGGTYFEKLQVQQLLVTRQGIDKNFDGLSLRGVNLRGANLVDASFIRADLSEANLQDADLSRAKLKQTQLYGSDFTGATLTGAYIEDWGITNDTKFDGVRCEYVYMRLPTKENPDPLRKPDNNAEVFADGDFGNFIKPIFDTLDLYHNQGVDPRAIAISFKELAEKNPDAELEIVGMEKRDQDKFLLRAKTAPEADKSQLSAEYFEIYNHVKALAEQEVKTLMAEKDSRIRSLENFVHTSLQRPNFYSNTQIEKVSNMTSNPGGFSVSGSVEGNINNVQGDNNRAVQGENNQAVLGDGNQVTQQNQVNTETEASLTKTDILALFAQLENLVQTAEVSQGIKETAIEDISAAKKATDKEEPKKNIALANLESVAQTIEKTSKTVDAGQKLWNKAKPIIVKIAGWLGAAASSYLLKL